MKTEEDERKEKLIKYIKENEVKFYRLIIQYVKTEEQTMDVLQEAIYNALKNINKLKKEEYMQTWFYRIVINESLKYIKKQKHNMTQDLQEYDMPCESKELEMSADILDLYQSLNKLKPKYKTVIVLKFFEDKSLEEISKITTTNLSTVKTRLYKALKELKMVIGDGNIE